MNLSDFGLKAIMAYEGFPHDGKPYICPAGVLTQGYGHTAAGVPVDITLQLGLPTLAPP